MLDAQEQLSTLLGKDVGLIRTTSGNPRRISVLDVARAITGRSGDYCGQAIRNILGVYPEVREKITNYKFEGRRQRLTPAADVWGLAEIVLLLPGRLAANVRRQAAEILVRYLGGDVSIVAAVCVNRGFQEELAVRAPEDPRRLFGEAVEAQPSTGSQ